jgi:DNA-binding beta-propeller fold protein YncE
LVLSVCVLVVFASCAGGSGSGGAKATATVSRPVATIGALLPVGHVDDYLATDAALWIRDSTNAGTLDRFDPTSKSIIASIHVGLDPQSSRGGIAVDDFGAWVTNTGLATLTKIDPHSDVVTATFHLTAGLFGPIASTDGADWTASERAVWMASRTQNVLTRIDPGTGKAVATLAVPTDPTSVASGAGAIWVCSLQGGTLGLTRVDPQTNQIVAHIDIGNSQGYQCSWVQFQTDMLWVVAFDTQTQRMDVLERIDPATNRVVATIHLQGDDLQTPVAIGAQDVWVCNDRTVYRINAQTNQVKGSVQFPGCSGALLSFGFVWLVSGSGGSLAPLTPST